MSESACGKASSDSSQSDKTFSCDHCEKEYATPGGLLYHVRNTECGDITCPICGEYFPTEKGLKTHRGSVHESVVTKKATCDYCDTGFEYNTNDTAGKFCCDGCCKKYREEQRTKKTCPECGDTFEVSPSIEDIQRFCGESCYARYSSRIQRGEKSHNWMGGGKAYYGENWRQKRRECLERDDHTCQDCGTTESLHVHHIQPLRTFAVPEEANTLPNLVTLCATCHLSKWEGIPLRPDTR